MNYYFKKFVKILILFIILILGLTIFCMIFEIKNQKSNYNIKTLYTDYNAETICNIEFNNINIIFETRDYDEGILMLCAEHGNINDIINIKQEKRRIMLSNNKSDNKKISIILPKYFKSNILFFVKTKNCDIYFRDSINCKLIKCEIQNGNITGKKPDFLELINIK